MRADDVGARSKTKCAMAMPVRLHRAAGCAFRMSWHLRRIMYLSYMPLRETDARRLLRRLLEEGIFVVSPHARVEMKKDNLTDVDVDASSAAASFNRRSGRTARGGIVFSRSGWRRWPLSSRTPKAFLPTPMT